MSKESKPSRAVILAGGKGRRLAPYTTVLPKPLMPIGDMPILEVVVRQLKYYGFTHITFSVGHLANLIQAFFGDGSSLGVKIDYSVEDTPLGTAGPLKLLHDLNDTFLVMNGDILTSLDYRSLIDFHRRSELPATISIYPREVKIDFGVIETGDNKLQNYIEKPTYYFTVSMGIYVFEPSVLSFMKNGEYVDIPELILRLRQGGNQVGCYKPECYWLDIGRIDDYEAAVKIFADKKVQFLKV